MNSTLQRVIGHWSNEFDPTVSWTGGMRFSEILIYPLSQGMSQENNVHRIRRRTQSALWISER